MMKHIGWLAVMAVACSTIQAKTGKDQAQNSKTGATKAKTQPPPAKTNDLAAQIASLLSEPVVARAHWGILVTTLNGNPLYKMNEGQYFQPASNNKLFTTAAAMALLGPETTFETKIVARGSLASAKTLTGDLALVGAGDANISGRVFPYVAPVPGQRGDAPGPDPLQYLAELADKVAATGLKLVTGDVVGDDTAFPWEPYPQGWSISETLPGYGAPVSALTINDNLINVTVVPAAVAGQPATVTLSPAVPYYTIDMNVMTLPPNGAGTVQITRALGSKVLRIRGAIATDTRPRTQEIAIQDPAEYAAIALKSLLEARGVAVEGVARAQHWIASEGRGRGSEALPSAMFDGTPGAACTQTDAGAGGTVLATHRSLPVATDITATLKVSQNLHAELLLHQLGRRMTCTGSTAQGTRVIHGFVEHIGIDKDDFVNSDGSGLSEHDLLTPRATAALLKYAAAQPWFAGWKASLPIGGVDGTLQNRFTASPVKGHLFAKTGTLGEARALGGYLECASGQTVILSVMETSHSPSGRADGETLDKIVAAIQAAE